MKRTLSILRHAKAADAEAYATDAERPLTSRGREDAARLGNTLIIQHMVPELVVCSSAVRTRETLAHLGFIVPTILSEKLYLASAGEMLAQLQQVDDKVTHVMIIGHNPGMHELVVRMMEDAKDEQDIKRLALKFPTCAYAQLSLSLSSWQDITLNSALLETYWVGKELPETPHSKRA
ncbi:MAG: SixA phosphatase family protein [Rickettsiales bacterium]